MHGYVSVLLCSCKLLWYVSVFCAVASYSGAEVTGWVLGWVCPWRKIWGVRDILGFGIQSLGFGAAGARS